MKLLKTLLLLSSILVFASCSSVKGLKNFTACKFNYRNVTNVRLADIDVTSAKSLLNLRLTDAPKIVSAIKNKQLPLTLDVNVDVDNPNNAVALLEGFDYILWIDDQEMVSGAMDKKLAVAPNSSATLSIPFSFNLFKVLTKEKIGPAAAFAFGLANNNADASRVKVSLKPYFTIGKKTIKLPSYVTVGGDKIMPKR